MSEGPCRGCMGNSATHTCDSMKRWATDLSAKKPIISDQWLQEWENDPHFCAWMERQPTAFENFVRSLIAEVRSLRGEHLSSNSTEEP